ncbi:MAG: DUF6090 family protein [Ignavibacteriaceae bacterium]
MKIFRNIRQKLASENLPDRQAGKAMAYLRYAVGEILLVVIGILIALQINNWNENRKLLKQEIEIYSELKSDLFQTKKEISSTINKHKKIIKSTQSLIYDIVKKEPYSKTIYNRFASSGDDFQIIPQTSAFESLKNIGLDILSNDSLRIRITDLYEIDLKRFDDELGDNNSDHSIKNILFPYQDKYFFADYNQTSKYGFKYADSITVQKLKIKDYNKFLRDNKLLKVLQLTLYNRSRKVDLETETIIKIDNTIKKIQKELNKLKK